MKRKEKEKITCLSSIFLLKYANYILKIIMDIL